MTKNKIDSLEKDKEQKLLKSTLENIGFNMLQGIEKVNFFFDSRETELDDIYVNANVILLVEYTTNKDSSHYKEKTIIYNKIEANQIGFIKTIKEKFNTVEQYITSQEYEDNQYIIKIIYWSYHSLSHEIKVLANSITKILDRQELHYFSMVSKVIKKSTIFEFIKFLGISFDSFGENITKSSTATLNRYQGYTIPEQLTLFNKDIKIVSFYIDPLALIKRSFVLRNEANIECNHIGNYQRMIDGSKITQMRKNLAENNGKFINNIIATISATDIKLYDSSEILIPLEQPNNFIKKITQIQIQLEDKPNIIGLIDGQHRVFSYHEGNDEYEGKIKQLRDKQNMLVTGLIIPESLTPEERFKTEASIFLEINSNQTSVKTELKQEIISLLDNFEDTSICKQIIRQLNSSGPLEDTFQLKSYDEDKIKISSIITYGLKPLIQYNKDKKNSLFTAWQDSNKKELRKRNNNQLLEKYIDFCTNSIRIILIAIKAQFTDKKKWAPNDLLTTTFIIGILKLIENLIKNDMLPSEVKDCFDKLAKIDTFDFSVYKSSQYSKLGIKLFEEFFKNKI